MNIAMTLKRMPTVDMQISDIVPVAGEIIMDATTNKVKIGDGKSRLKDLCWVDLGLDLAKEESSLSRTARMFIENNIELIENNDYDALYSHIATDALAQEVTRALLKADLNPEPYLSIIPQSIRHILEPEKVWEAATERLYYTNQDVDQLMQQIDQIDTQLAKQFGIPKELLCGGDNNYGT